MTTSAACYRSFGGWRILFLGFTAAALLATAIIWRGVPESLSASADDLEETPAVPDGIDQLRRMKNGVCPVNCGSFWGL